MAILEARGLRKQFGSVTALSDGTFELRKGEVHAVVGDNGAGKSTLLKIVTGVLRPDGGTLLIDGKPVEMQNPNSARALGIMTVFQNLALVDHLDVTANLFLGRELYKRPPLAWLGVLNKRAMRREALERLRDLRIGIHSIDHVVMNMSGGQRQAVAVARAMSFGARIVIMDEPTASLGVRESGAVMDLIRAVREDGTSVLLVSHDLPNVFKVADRITVLRLGRRVTTIATESSSLKDVVSLITGAAVSIA